MNMDQNDIIKYPQNLYQNINYTPIQKCSISKLNNRFFQQVVYYTSNFETGRLTSSH